MSVVLAAGDIILLQLYSHVAEQGAINAFHYRVQTVGSPAATDEDVASQFPLAFATNYKKLIENRGNYDGCGVRVINKLPLPALVLDATNNGVGTGGADGLPRQTCGLISWRTGFAGPGKRGRTYTPFPPTAANETGGSITNAFQTDIEAFGNNMTGLIVISTGGRTANLVHIIWSGKTNTFQDVTEFTTSNKWATQRKRGSYGRANTNPLG